MRQRRGRTDRAALQARSLDVSAPGLAGGAAGATGPGGAGVRSALSLMTHAAFRATPHSPPPRLLAAAQNWKIWRKVHSVSADPDSRKYSAI